MFSGIIQGIGKIDTIESNNTIIKTNVDLSDCKIGSSISCNGVCLTATSIKKLNGNNFIFSVNISEETKNRSTFNYQNFSQTINIEKSLKVGDEISGHFVYGHVDTILELKKIEKFKNSWEFTFSMFSLDNSKNIKKFIVEKGSISINGISLTVANLYKNTFSVSIIPHTFDNTNLFNLKEKDKVNIEFDPLARYINKNYDR